MSTTSEPNDPALTSAQVLQKLRGGKPAVTRPHHSPWSKTFNMWVRRIHLYSGLLLLPWVFLYGVTGFLFNHPTFFASGDVRFVSPGEVRGTALDALPSPEAVAARVVAELNADQEKKYSLVEETASYARGTMRVTFTDQEGKSQAWTIDPADHGGNIRANNARGGREREKEKAPFERKDLQLDNPLKDLLAAAAPQLLPKLGYESVSAIKPEVGALAFRLTDGETTWQASYSEALGTVTGERVREAEAQAMPFRQFLLRLHLVHHYPSEFGIRWIYAVIVDVMSLTMLFWGISGVIMWLQIKRTRVLGALLLLVAMIAAAAIAPLMYEVFTTGGR
jgi:hypothetical protein